MVRKSKQIFLHTELLLKGTNNLLCFFKNDFKTSTMILQDNA